MKMGRSQNAPFFVNIGGIFNSVNAIDYFVMKIYFYEANNIFTANCICKFASRAD